VKERPILMSAPMVRAILAGTKTQTRRVVKLQPPAVVQSIYRPFPAEPNNWQGYGFGSIHWYGRCPYGVAGDRLWVRETWAVPHRYDHLGPSNIPTKGVPVHYAATEDRGGLRWRPSIHMCRFASRITLEITDVRVERLQEISEADAIAEGCVGGHGASKGYAYNATPHEHYRALWESINGPGSWDLNPWVWAISFRRVT
jgi:hypothetical protein